MTNLRSVFFPLRSNIGWFQSDNLKAEMSNRIKQALLLYDELIIEDGTFTATIFNAGKIAMHHPKGFFPSEQRTIEFERDIKPANMTLVMRPSDGSSPGHAFMSGRTIARFKVDYFSILKDIDISSYDFIKLIGVNAKSFPSEAQTYLRDSKRQDERMFKGIHANSFFRSFVIENLNYDLVASMLLQSAVVLDSRHEALLREKCRLPKESLKFFPVKEESVVRHLMSIAVPDFDSLTLQEVLEHREDSLWKDFRGFVGKISSSISADPSVLIDPEKLQKQVDESVAKELFQELKKRYPKGKDLAIDMGLGVASLIPGFNLVSVAGTVKAGIKYLQQQSGWFAFLLKLSNR